jgi:hypothetical protein
LRHRAPHPGRQPGFGPDPALKGREGGQQPPGDLSLRARRARPFWALLLLVQLWLPGSPALAAPARLEDLRYQMAVLAWQDAARVRVTLKDQGQGRLVAEVLGETRGFIKLISGNHRERLQTEMVWRNGRLVPLIYREESWREGKHDLKEYRFDYPRARLEMWQRQEGQGLLKKWETVLHEQVYDPLSAFYNCRLRTLGPTREGEASTIPGIPYPRPEAIEVRLGPETKDGRQAMVSLVNSAFEDSRGVVFAFIDEQRLPRRVWTTVFGITIKGALLPESVMMPAGLPGLPPSAPVAARRPHVEAPKSATGRGNQP